MAEGILERVPNAPPELVSAVLGIAAAHAQDRGDYKRQRALSHRRLELVRAHGNELEVAWTLFYLGSAFEGAGEFDTASGHFQEALQMFRAWEGEGAEFRQNIGWTLSRLGECAASNDNFDAATSYFEECALVFGSINDGDGVASAHSQLGSVTEVFHSKAFCWLWRSVAAMDWKASRNTLSSLKVWRATPFTRLPRSSDWNTFATSKRCNCSMF